MRLRKGDICIYHGAPQSSVLAPGDEVEVEQDCDPGYRIKLNTPYATTIYYCRDEELSFASLPSGHSGINKLGTIKHMSYDELREHRKERGECLSCGKLLPMSMHGLSHCSCSPPPLVKW